MATSFNDFFILWLVAVIAYYLGATQTTQPAPQTAPMPLDGDAGKVGAANGEMMMIHGMVDPNTKVAFHDSVRFTVAQPNLSLLGVGTRKLTIMNVYSMGLYVSPAIKEQELSKIDTSIKGDDTVCQILLKTTSPRAVQLVFTMNIGPEKIAEAVSQLKGVKKALREEFYNMIVEGLAGEGKMKKGESMTFEWKGADIIAVTARGTLLGSMKNESLARGVFELYVGKKSVSPSLRKSIGCL